jgi:hypothetical protein
LIAKYAGQKGWLYLSHAPLHFATGTDLFRSRCTADLEQISNIFNQASHQYELMRSQPPPQQAQPGRSCLLPPSNPSSLAASPADQSGFLSFFQSTLNILPLTLNPPNIPRLPNISPLSNSILPRSCPNNVSPARPLLSTLNLRLSREGRLPIQPGRRTTLRRQRLRLKLSKEDRVRHTPVSLREDRVLRGSHGLQLFVLGRIV